MGNPAHDRASRPLQKVVDYLIGLGIVIKGWEKAEHFGDYPLLVIFLFLAGLLIILGASFHDRIEKKVPNFSAIFHVLEGSALIASAIILLEKGRSRIPYFLFFIGAVYLILGIVRFFTPEKKREKYLHRLQLVLGVAFLAAAAATLVLNAVFVHIIWMTVTAAALAVAGIILLLAGKGAGLSHHQRRDLGRDPGN